MVERARYSRGCVTGSSAISSRSELKCALWGAMIGRSSDGSQRRSVGSSVSNNRSADRCAALPPGAGTRHGGCAATSCHRNPTARSRGNNAAAAAAASSRSRRGTRASRRSRARSARRAAFDRPGPYVRARSCPASPTAARRGAGPAPNRRPQAARRRQAGLPPSCSSVRNRCRVGAGAGCSEASAASSSTMQSDAASVNQSRLREQQRADHDEAGKSGSQRAHRVCCSVSRSFTRRPQPSTLPGPRPNTVPYCAATATEQQRGGRNAQPHRRRTGAAARAS